MTHGGTIHPHGARCWDTQGHEDASPPKQQASRMTDIDTEICTELPGEYQEFLDAVGRLSKAIYGVV